MKKISQIHKPDFIFIAVIAVLLAFGLLMIYNASPVTSLRDFGDPLYLVKQQIVWVFAGLFFGFVAFLVPYYIWAKLAPFLMLGALALLLAVFIPGLGIEIYGAQRWLNLGFTSLQPAEFAKLSYVLLLATIFSKKTNLLVFSLISALILGIVLLQRDMGTSIVILFLGLAVYFVAGAPWWHFAAIVPTAALMGAALIATSNYRKARLLAFLNPTVDPQGISYHLHQALIALGSGGLFGVGLGQSRQKYGFIPEVTTDSIFAVIGNEIGFFGSLIFISLFLLLLFRGFKIASEAPDKLGHFIAVGLVSWILVQTFVNISGMVALLPLTGVPLPFISYGGSSMLSIMIATGIILNISRHTSSNRSRIELKKV